MTLGPAPSSVILLTSYSRFLQLQLNENRYIQCCMVIGMQEMTARNGLSTQQTWTQSEFLKNASGTWWWEKRKRTTSASKIVEVRKWKRTQLLMMKIKRPTCHMARLWGRWRKREAYNTCCSQAVSHPSTEQAQRFLTSVIRWEPVYSAWYGRRQEVLARNGLRTKQTWTQSEFCISHLMVRHNYASKVVEVREIKE